MLFVLFKCYIVIQRYDIEFAVMRMKSAFRSCEHGSHSEQWISTRRCGALRRLRASPAIKTLKVPSILLDHGFKSHIPSAYLNENPDCAALPKRGEARCARGSRNICYTQKISHTEIQSDGFLRKTELNKTVLKIKLKKWE